MAEETNGDDYYQEEKKEDEFITFEKTYAKFMANPLSLRPVFVQKRIKQVTKNIYVVSHSRIMQCALETFDMQGKLHENVENHEDFDFEQNVWTIELNISDNELVLTDIYDGIPKPETNKAQVPGSDVPGTIIDSDTQCTLDKSAVGKYAYDKLFGERPIKYKEGQAVEKKREPFFRKIHKYEKENYLKAQEYDTTPQDSICIFVTRHANSCNNIQAEGNLAKLKKKFDPSLSDYGFYSLTSGKFPNVQLDSLKGQRPETEPVYVSCCIRTWMTAILIYGNYSSKQLHLLVSPYIKEKGNDPGNIPDSIPEQLNKLDSWFDQNKTKLKVTDLHISILPISRDKIIPIYSRKNDSTTTHFNETYQYNTEHTTFYADGILKFSHFIYNFDIEKTVVFDDKNTKYKFTNPSGSAHSGTSLGGKIVKKTKSVKKMKKKSTSKLYR